MELFSDIIFENGKYYPEEVGDRWTVSCTHVRVGWTSPRKFVCYNEFAYSDILDCCIWDVEGGEGHVATVEKSHMEK